MQHQLSSNARLYKDLELENKLLKRIESLEKRLTGGVDTKFANKSVQTDSVQAVTTQTYI